MSDIQPVAVTINEGKIQEKPQLANVSVLPSSPSSSSVITEKEYHAQDQELSPLQGPILEYSEDEESKVRRKLDFLVMPLLFIGFYVFQVRSDNMVKDHYSRNAVCNSSLWCVSA